MSTAVRPATSEFIAFAQSWRFRLYLLRMLPSAFFAGLRVRAISPTECAVSVPFRWFSQNPFRSIYFACLAMGGELAAGLLAMAHLHRLQPSVSMLVTHCEAEFVKKATDVAVFTCADGDLLRSAIEESVRSGEGCTVPVRSVGRNAAGEIVALFTITWSFRPRQPRAMAPLAEVQS
ncbi:DUF4442 domain-containing protein [Opitutus sp. ER46]|uniref:DUF4442 domain-containing protein n=1 Tax=Opitutus sp. ER46 TaxID=2161864 RepID=UPI000D31D94C|nr:DUF4442 domain-containing protein [Opitutus sp. ER46]PTX91220.1 thioesterase [Opitutus sp. ER46]